MGARLLRQSLGKARTFSFVYGFSPIRWLSSDRYFPRMMCRSRKSNQSLPPGLFLLALWNRRRGVVDVGRSAATRWALRRLWTEPDGTQFSVVPMESGRADG